MNDSYDPGAVPEVLLIRCKASLVAGLVTCIIGVNSVELVNIRKMVGLQMSYFGFYYVYDSW